MKSSIRRMLALAMLALTARSVPVGGATFQQVNAAIEKGKAYLYAQQKDGHWEFAPEFNSTAAKPGSNTFETGDWGGLTAMATHALLAAGETANNPKLRPTIDLLLKWQMRMCPYALCQRDQVLELLRPDAEVKEVAHKDGTYLEKSMRTAGQAAGLYYYFPPYPGQNPGSYDHSVSQYGVLAMWACGEAGFEVPLGYWETTERAWQRHQQTDGGWNYTFDPKGGSTASMTAAGVATLFITQDYVHSMEGLDCHGNITNPAIDKGMAWLSKNFDQAIGSGWNPYTLYGIERVGVAGGYKYFGTRDWFKEGADWFMKTQNADGSWGAGGWLSGYNHKNIPATCFALFFLSRGRAPVAFNKARYDAVAGAKHEEGRWNQRPRDVANITTWVEKHTERALNWHVVNLADTPVDQLHDAPVLYLSGDRKLELSADDEAKIKQFIEDGGMVLGNPDNNSKAFIDSFRSLGTKLFPKYEMRPLPPDHVVYGHEQFRGQDIRKKDAVLGLSNGVRELMVVPAYDWGKSWQAAAYSNEDAYRLAANVYLYAVGRTSFAGNEILVVHPDAAIKAVKTVKLARLDYGGNSDPEPGGWRRLAALLHNNDKIDLNAQTVKLGDGTLSSPPADTVVRPSAEAIRETATKRITPAEFQATGGDATKMQALVAGKVHAVEAELAAEEAKRMAAMTPFKQAYMTGTANFAFTPAQRADIKRFIDGGGLLMIDAAGGSQAFADAAEKELLAMYPNDATTLSQPIPQDDPLYQTGKPGEKFNDWNYRRYTRDGGRHGGGPQLRGMKMHDRWVVLLSREDISNALVGRDMDGVVGYTAQTATALMTQVLKKLGR